MPRQDEAQDMSIQDHLSGDAQVDTSGYTDVCMPHKDRRQEFLENGYEVIKDSENSDLLLVGKPKGEQNGET